MDVSRYIGKSFEDKGRGPDTFDCYGLIRAIYKNELGIELPNYLGYASATDGFKIPLIYVKERSNWKEVLTPQQYDVIVLEINSQPMHVGVYIGDDKFIHICKGICVTVESVNSNMWKNRIHNIYRYDR